MRVVRSARRLPRGAGRVVSIGSFDGVHVGHQKILKRLSVTARRKRAKSIVLTFRNHPQKVLRPQRPMPLLISLERRLKLIEELGIDYCLLVDFNKNFFSQQPEEFVRTFLIKSLKANYLVLGYNFCFGKDRKGNARLLRRLSKKYGFGLTIVPALRRAGKVISSTRIRRLIETGQAEQARRLMGRPYALQGRVVHGDGRGRRLGYPTANIRLDRDGDLPIGVYATRVAVGRSLRPGMVNIGWRPTFVASRDRPAKPTVEVHLFDFRRNITGSRVQLDFLKRIRGERRFTSSQALRAQLARDERKARQIDQATKIVSFSERPS